jgi:hypothetical protein
MEGWKDGRMEGWKDGRMEGWKDGRMEGWKDGRMEGCRLLLISKPKPLSSSMKMISSNHLDKYLQW